MDAESANENCGPAGVLVEPPPQPASGSKTARISRLDLIGMMVARKTITANAHLNSSEIAREHQMLAVQGFGSLIRTPSTAPEYAGPRRLDLEKSRAITRALTVKVLPVRRFCNAFSISPDYGIRKLTYSQVWT